MNLVWNCTIRGSKISYLSHLLRFLHPEWKLLPKKLHKHIHRCPCQCPYLIICVIPFNLPNSQFTNKSRKILDTQCNAFGLYRRYYSHEFPSHDPESEADISSLSDIVYSGEHPQASDYGPYPNKNSFRLGDWYWNHGIQKSQASFKELIHIIGDVDFQPSDIRSTNWDEINKSLAKGGVDEYEWEDEDAGWTASPVSISVPFHRNTPTPGPRDYISTKFHHRSLVSVIREKLTRDASHFHYQPYELLWQTSNKSNPVRIHSELYTSPAFIEAHNLLQDSPGEPGCKLSRFIVALMFWSDGTHLTNFGNAKLWPLYMFFGNESKYRRGKPSFNLCEHVAYFETVRCTSSHHYFYIDYV